MKLRPPRCSMRFLLAAMLIIGVGLGIAGRELLKARQTAQHQRELIASLSAKGVEIASKRRQGKLTAFESVLEFLDGKPLPTEVGQVTLRKGSFDDSDIAMIAELNGLEYFVDEFGHCTDEGLRFLSNNPTLRYIRLERWLGSTKGATALVNGKAPLTEVLLGIPSIDDDFLKQVPKSRALKHLYMVFNNATSDGLSALQAVQGLERLDIDQGKQLGVGFSALGKSPNLRDLGLHHYEFGEGDLEGFSKLDQIEKLYFDAKQFPAGVIRCLSGLKKLKELSLTGPLDPAEPFEFQPSTEISQISFPRTNIMPRELIGQLAKVKGIRSINLSQLVVSEEDLNSLSSVENLRMLTIAEGSPPAAIARLQLANPKCKVNIKLKNNKFAHVDEQGKLVIPTPKTMRSAANSSELQSNGDRK